MSVHAVTEHHSPPPPLSPGRVDLKNGHSDKPEFPSIKKVLMGDSHKKMLGERCSSLEEQIAVLIDHATDPNILGRTWQGWQPWV